MNESDIDQNALGQLLHDLRLERGLSFSQLAAETGIAKGQLHKLEQGQVKKVNPTQLALLAGPLGIELADLYAAAGYRPPDLPSFRPYLRAKYRDLPAAAQAELEQSFAQIARAYGYDPHGPVPGEDEQ